MLSEEVKRKRMDYITSTEVAALYGVSAHNTLFTLYHEKIARSLEPDYAENERMKWGFHLEKPIAMEVAARLDFICSSDNDFRTCDTKKIAASYDYKLYPEAGNSVPLEIKNVDGLIFRDQWAVEGDEIIKIPLHIELQIQTQLLLKDVSYGYLAVLAGGNKLYIKEVTAIKKVQESIVKKVGEFWALTSEPSPIDDHSADQAAITKLFTQVEMGEPLDASDDVELDKLTEQYKKASDAASAATRLKDKIKTEILHKVGNSPKVWGENFKISRSPVAPKEISYTRKGYTTFRVTRKK